MKKTAKDDAENIKKKAADAAREEDENLPEIKEEKEPICETSEETS